MIIGLDIDNVISDFDGAMLKVFLDEDKNKRGKGIVDPNAHYLKGMLDWSEEELEDWMKKTCEPYAKVLRLKPNAKKYIDLLMKRGHTVILITHRTQRYFLNPEEVTLKWLKDKKINYHKIVFSNSADKSVECFENGIDLMFDDRVGHVKMMIESGVNCVAVQTKYNKKQCENIPSVKNFKQIYEYVLSCEKQK